MVLGDDDWMIDVTIRWIQQERVDYELWLAKWSNLTDEAGPERWKTPPLGTIKLNTDGAYSQSNDRMGMGGVVRDTTRSWIAGFMAGSLGGDPLLAEVRALTMGLNLLWDANIRCAMCEVDCLELVQTLQGGRFHFHELASELGALNDLIQRT